MYLFENILIRFRFHFKLVLEKQPMILYSKKIDNNIKHSQFNGLKP